jgi:hypothetical protein
MDNFLAYFPQLELFMKNKPKRKSKTLLPLIVDTKD